MVKDTRDTEAELLAVYLVSSSKLSNRHVIKVFDFWFDRALEVSRAYILMERCQRNLEQYLQTQREKNTDLEPLEIVDIMLQILNGLRHCHDQRVCHRDLKLSNGTHLNLAKG